MYLALGNSTSSDVGVVMEYGEPDDAPGQSAPKPNAEPSGIPSAKR